MPGSTGRVVCRDGRRLIENVNCHFVSLLTAILRSGTPIRYLPDCSGRYRCRMNVAVRGEFNEVRASVRPIKAMAGVKRAPWVRAKVTHIPAPQVTVAHSARPLRKVRA